jgi:hypothetical protein
MNGSPVWFWPNTISGIDLSIRELRRFADAAELPAELTCAC